MESNDNMKSHKWLVVCAPAVVTAVASDVQNGDRLGYSPLTEDDQESGTDDLDEIQERLSLIDAFNVIHYDRKQNLTHLY